MLALATIREPHTPFDWVIGIILIVTLLGGTTWGIRIMQASFRHSLTNLPPFPITLKPYPLLTVLTGSFALLQLIACIYLMNLNERSGSFLLWYPYLMVDAVIWHLFYYFLRARITIDDQTLTYQTPSKRHEIKIADIVCHRIHYGSRISELVLTCLHNKKDVKIPLIFQNMSFLYEAIVFRKQTRRKKDIRIYR